MASDASIALDLVLIMPVALSLLALVTARKSKGDFDQERWLLNICWLRILFLLTIATWWSLNSVFESDPLLSLLPFFPRSFNFVLLPTASLVAARILTHWSSRRVLGRRWTSIDIWRLAFWNTMAQPVPLLMLAAGIETIRRQPLVAFLWLAGAAACTLVGTLKLRAAEGFNPRLVHSGELRKRARVIARRMNIDLKEVFVVPSGRGHLTNAFASLSNSIGITDDYGKWLKGSQLDFVIGHELAHIERKHTLKKLVALLALFSVVSMLGFALPLYTFSARMIFPFFAILTPLLCFYLLSRKFEYEADLVGIDLADDVDSCIEALSNLDRQAGLPAKVNRFQELFSSHPSRSRRVEAIARTSEITASAARR